MSYLDTAIEAARQAGVLLRENYERDLNVDAALDHDLKLELDRKSQDLITDIILKAHPDHAILGEEGIAGDQDSDFEWIVDPIDGTVNYFYGIPHFCISIAMREAGEITVGVVYDPMLDELYSVGPNVEPNRNGKPISVSNRDKLSDAIITVGFSKTNEGMEAGIERYKRIAFQVRKTRMLGSAALGMAYVASGRLDAYIEESVSIWDIAAGKLLIERAGGKVVQRDKGDNTMGVVSSNGKLPLENLEKDAGK
ncbi:MAG: inositol monophosphatase family protein [Verrucomicrobiota bacterium]